MFFERKFDKISKNYFFDLKSKTFRVENQLTGLEIE